MFILPFAQYLRGGLSSNAAFPQCLRGGLSSNAAFPQCLRGGLSSESRRVSPLNTIFSFAQIHSHTHGRN